MNLVDWGSHEVMGPSQAHEVSFFPPIAIIALWNVAEHFLSPINQHNNMNQRLMIVPPLHWWPQRSQKYLNELQWTHMSTFLYNTNMYRYLYHYSIFMHFYLFLTKWDYYKHDSTTCFRSIYEDFIHSLWWLSCPCVMVASATIPINACPHCHQFLFLPRPTLPWWLRQ